MTMSILHDITTANSHLVAITRQSLEPLGEEIDNIIFSFKCMLLFTDVLLGRQWMCAQWRLSGELILGQLTMDELNENIEIVQNASNIQNGVLIQNENHNLEKLVQNLAALVITEHKRVWEVYLAARYRQVKVVTSWLMNEPEYERSSLVNTLYMDGKQSTTPLIIVARNGHTSLVTTLLNSYSTWSRGPHHYGVQLELSTRQLFSPWWVLGQMLTMSPRLTLHHSELLASWPVWYIREEAGMP